MAGSLAVVSSEQQCRNAATAVWKVRFARFFPYPAVTAICQPLVPLSKNKGRRPPRGTWMSSSSSNASLMIIKDDSSSDAILTVDLCGNILEEHYISKLNFSWPQMSCVSGFPARGSIAIFVSYRDSSSEIQKFALRFSINHDVYTFIAALKENLKGLKEIELQKYDLRPEISSQSEFESTKRLSSRACELTPLDSFAPQVPLSSLRPEISLRSEFKSTERLSSRACELTPLDSYAPQVPLSSNYEVQRLSCTPQTVHNHNPNGVSSHLLEFYAPEMLPSADNEVEQPLYVQRVVHNHNPNGVSSSLPPSFTSLLSRSFSDTKQDAGGAAPTQEIDLKSQIMKYMEDSAFQDMLLKVERVIDEIGGDWSL